MGLVVLSRERDESGVPCEHASTHSRAKVVMPRLYDLHRISLTFGTIAILAGCATATGHTGVAGGIDATQTSNSIGSVSQNVLLARADSAWQAGAYSLANILYEGAVGRDSSASLAVFRLATLRTWDNRRDEGIRLYRRYVTLRPRDPEGRLALARALAWSGQYPAALAIYDSVIAQSQANHDAGMGRAKTLAWAGRFPEALAVYKRWLADHPADREASLEYARALSWTGQFEKAEAMYTDLARTGDANAQKGLARVIAWRGELKRSEHAGRQVLDV